MTTRSAVRELDAELGRALDQHSRSVSPRARTETKPLRASGGADGRPDPLDLGGHERDHEAQDAGPGSAGGGAQLTHGRVGDAQLQGLHPFGVHDERSSAGDRAATASTALDRSVSARLASRARAAARTTSGNPAPDSTAPVIASSDSGRARPTG